MWWKREKEEEVIYEVALPGDREGEIDVTSPTWKWIRKWVGEELKRARERNDYPKLDEQKTSALRGRIKLLKEIINLPTKVDKK